MNQSSSSIALMGSTGSIGKSSLEVVAASSRFNIASLSAHSQLPAVVDQALEFNPRFVVASDESHAASFDWSRLPSDTELLVGSDGLEKVARSEDVDIVIAAIVGSAGLRSTWAALDAGKRVALANKETLVVAGPLVRQLIDDRGGEILPVDSEHSAIFQALAAGRREDVHRILLTASGGPFRGYTQSQLENVTVEQALAHPTWQMGKKITIDSATMMNKALEIIEARWLFDLDAEQIDVVVHPQSVVHSMVEYVDGSVMAQMSPPDMKLPIQYALTYPERCASPAAKCDFSQAMSLDFEPPDHDNFPAVRLGLEVARVGGTAGVVVNAANEAAVEKFIGGELTFTEIVPACRAVLENHDFDSTPSLERLFELDQWAREEVTRWVCI